MQDILSTKELLKIKRRAVARRQTLHLRLDADLRARFDLLASRLELEPKDAARRLLKAAIEALEDKQEFTWPLYLVQAGDKVASLSRF